MQDLEQGDMLEKILKLTEENNILLVQMRRAARWATFFQALYWLIIIGLSIGAFYFVQPYINSLVGNIDAVQSQVDMFKEFVK